jgi:hypothetical protein
MAVTAMSESMARMHELVVALEQSPPQVTAADAASVTDSRSSYANEQVVLSVLVELQVWAQAEVRRYAATARHRVGIERSSGRSQLSPVGTATLRCRIVPK